MIPGLIWRHDAVWSKDRILADDIWHAYQLVLLALSTNGCWATCENSGQISSSKSKLSFWPIFRRSDVTSICKTYFEYVDLRSGKAKVACITRTQRLGVPLEYSVQACFQILRSDLARVPAALLPLALWRSLCENMLNHHSASLKRERNSDNDEPAPFEQPRNLVNCYRWAQILVAQSQSNQASAIL
jgi:hypothetical protein